MSREAARGIMAHFEYPQAMALAKGLFYLPSSL